MKRRTLDILIAASGLVVALLLAVLGYVIINEGQFAKDYVKTELAAQKITFAPAEKLTDAEKNWKPGSVCLTQYAGKLMETGAMAECYAKYYIREHMNASGVTAGFPGATYGTLGDIRTDLQAQVAAAKAKGDTAAADAAQKKWDAATALRTSLQSGESLSGMLLTVYGFSVIGDKATQAGQILYICAAILAVVALAGFVHAFVTPKDKVVLGALAPAPTR